MLKQINHFDTLKGKAPVYESTLSNPHGNIEPRNVTKYAIKGNERLYEIFIRLAPAAAANGARIDAERLRVSTIEIARAAAMAEFADKELDLRPEEDRATEAAHRSGVRKPNVVTAKPATASGRMAATGQTVEAASREHIDRLARIARQ